MIPLYGCNASGATILRLDDPSSDLDQGEIFAASLLSAKFEGRTDLISHLRRIVQGVHLTESASVTVLPIADGAEDFSEGESILLLAPDGQDQLADTDPDVTGRFFQILLVVTSHVGLTELGECMTHFVVRRGRLR